MLLFSIESHDTLKDKENQAKQIRLLSFTYLPGCLHSTLSIKLLFQLNLLDFSVVT